MKKIILVFIMVLGVTIGYSQSVKGKFNFSKKGLMINDSIRSSEALELKTGTIKFDVLPQKTTSNKVLSIDSMGRVGYRTDSSVVSSTKKDRIELGYLSGSIIRAICIDSEAIVLTTNIGVMTLLLPNANIQSHNILADNPSFSNLYITGVLVRGQYLYVGCADFSPPYGMSVLRYQKRDLTINPVTMTTSGLSLGSSIASGVYMVSDGSFLYFNYDANNSTSGNIVAKYAISGTQLVYQGSITHAVPSSNTTFFVSKLGDVFFYNLTGNLLYKCSSNGILLNTYPAVYQFKSFLNWNDDVYIGVDANSKCYQKIYLR
jgi:hypothetical protein